VVKFEVDVSLTLGFGGGFTEGWGLAQVGLVKFFFVGLIGGFWEHTFFFEGGHDTEWFFDQFDGGGKIHTEIDGLPVDTFFFVFFLFKDEHMVVEELLEFFVGEVDAQLFESVESKNFKTGDIEATDKEGSWKLGGKSFVTVLSNEVEQSFEDGFGQGTSGVSDLIWGLTFGNVFGTNLYSWGTQVFEHISRVKTKEVSALVGGFSSIWLGLFFSLLLFESGTLEVHNTGGDFPDTVDDFW
jgi:hypothetical protein